MENFNPKKGLFLFHLFIGLTGITLLIIAWFERPSVSNDGDSTYWFSFLLNIGSGLITTAGITIFLSYFLVPNNSVDDEIIKSYAIQILERLGLDQYKDSIRKFFLREKIISSSRFPYSEKNSLNLIKASIRPGPVKVGKKNISLNYFIDLMDMVLSDQQDRDQLVNDMCHFINFTCKGSEDKNLQIDYDKIVAHKMGNPTMAIEISYKLKKPCIFFNKDDDYTVGNEITPIEGTLNLGDRVIIVHDVVATGSRIKPMIEYLLKRGAKVDHFFVFAERNDKQIKAVRARHYFKSKNIIIHPLHSLNDNSLKNILDNKI